MAEDRRKLRYQLTQKGIELLPAMIALRQWGEKWGAGVPSTPVLVDARDEQPIGPVTITAHDGRALGYGELMWKNRSELQPLGQARQRTDKPAAPVAADRCRTGTGAARRRGAPSHTEPPHSAYGSLLLVAFIWRARNSISVGQSSAK